MRVKRGLIASVIVLALAATGQAGGWAILTLRDLPEYAVAGTPLRLTFMLRQHGVTPVTGLTPVIQGRSGTASVETTAVATKTEGEYTATLVFPRPGTWTFEIGPFATTTLPALTVIAPGRPAPPPLSPVTLGARLFVAKGCIGCHVTRDVDAQNLVEAGPDLTAKRFPAPYLRRLLDDPQATFARDAAPERGEMPNLELTESETAALVAFINRERPRPRPAK